MTLTDKIQHVEYLKARLDELRPLPPDVVAELRQWDMVRFTYNSNAIEGNTLTQSETEMLLERGITVGGKMLVEHLEIIGHRDAISSILEFAQTEFAIRALEIRPQIFFKAFSKLEFIFSTPKVER